MNTDINKPGTENIAGIKSVRFADINNVESIENGILKMKQGFQLKKIAAKRGKWGFEGDFLNSYDFKLSGIISGHDKTILASTILATNSDLVVVVDLDNISYIAGNPDEGIHFKFNHTSGTVPGEETGYKLELYRKLRAPVIVLNSIQ